MTGYQEILTDPSYRGQIVVMTQPHIGNYGTAAELGESRQPWVEAFVAHQFTARHSGQRRGQPAAVPARARHPGAPRDRHPQPGAAPARARRHARRRHQRALGRRCPGRRGARVAADGGPRAGRRGHLRRGATRCCPRASRASGSPSTTSASRPTSCARCSSAARALEVLPARTPASVVRDLGVDGVVLSNGPGDPEPLREMIDAVAELVAARLPGARHLPRPPAARARAGRQDQQAQVRPPRRQPAGQGPRHRRGRDHQPEPRLHGRSRLAARGCPRHPGEPQRRHGRGSRRRRAAGVLGPVPPRGRPGSPRRACRSSRASSNAVDRQ